MSTTNSPPPLSPPHALLAAARAGDDQAFAAIVRQHGPPVMTTCLRWVKDHHLAEDLSQDVFVRLLGSDIEPLDDRELRRWLLQVARNAAIDHHRHHEVVRRSEEAANDLVVPEAAPQRTVEMRVLIAQVLDELSDRDAELVVEHYVEDVSLRDMAARRGTTRDTIKVQLHRARSRARTIARDRWIDGLPWLPAPLVRLGSTIKGIGMQVGVKGAVAVLTPLLVLGGIGLMPGLDDPGDGSDQAAPSGMAERMAAALAADRPVPDAGQGAPDAQSGPSTATTGPSGVTEGAGDGGGDAADRPPTLPQDVIPNGRVTIPNSNQTLVESSDYSDRQEGTQQLMLLPGVTHEDGVTGLAENPDDTPEERAAFRRLCELGGRAEPVLECQDN